MNTRPKTIEEQVYYTIRDAIRSQVYPPGYHLNENKLSADLGVSRSPIRDALNRLQGDGLLITIPNKGTFVKILSDKEIQEMHMARGMFETFAVANLPEHLDQATVNRFLSFKDQFTAALGNQHMYLIIDRAFHAEIVSLTYNEYIIKLYDDLNWKINYMSAKDDQVSEYLKVLHSSHISMIDHLLKGQYDELLALSKKHLELAKFFQKSIHTDPPVYQPSYTKTQKRKNKRPAFPPLPDKTDVS